MAAGCEGKKRRSLPLGFTQMSQDLFQKSLFEQISVCCWPRIVVKIDPKRSFFTFGPPLAARNTSKVASGLLLGCSWAAPGCSWAAPGCSWAPPGSSWAHTQVYAQAVLKVGAPGDVSSVGGTPGVWCLNVIGRECWVWVVPCTGSWPGQPPPTKWGKEP